MNEELHLKSDLIEVIELHSDNEARAVSFDNDDARFFVLKYASTDHSWWPRSGLFRVVHQSDGQERIDQAFHNFEKQVLALHQERQMIIDLKSQVRELETLTVDLEQVVQERTQFLEKSKAGVDDQIGELRLYLKFVMEVSQLQGLDDWILFLKKEFRKRFSIHNLHLFFQSGSTNWIFSDENHFQFQTFGSRNQNQVPDARLMANHFGRPFVSMKSIELSTPGLEQIIGQKARAFLLIERGPSNFLSDSLEKTLQTYREPLQLSLDHILMEMHLTQSSFRLEKTFESLKEPLAIIGANYDILRANPNFLRNRTNSRKCYQAFADRDEPCEGCPLQESLMHTETRVQRVYIQDIQYELHSDPVKMSESQGVHAVVHHYFNLTERNHRHGEIIQAEKMIALGQLAGRMAHELNNPLTGLLALSQIMQSEVNSENQIYKDLVEIEQATKRCLKIISSLMSFADNRQIDLQVHSLQQLIEDVLPLVKMSLRQHQLVLQNVDAEIKVKVDQHFFQHILFNLLNNAAQASPRGTEIRIEVRVLVDEKWAMISVVDYGSGMSEEVQKKLFQPFFTTKSLGQGTGLGLSLTKSLVESMSGEIEFESKLNVGTKFTIRVPLAGEDHK